MGISRQRAIPPELWTDEDLIALPIPVRMTLFGLYAHADDQGRETATTWQLKGSIWPGNPEITEDLLVDHLLQLDETGWLHLYSDEQRTYYSLPVFPTPSHPRPSRFPAPTEQRRNGDGDAPERLPAMERERDGEERDAPSGLPPSPFCRVHQPSGSGGVPCVRCQDARLEARQWERERRLRVVGEGE